MKIRNFVKDKWEYPAVLAVCFLLLFVHCIVGGLWPFGSASIVDGDGTQYFYSVVEQWDRLHGGLSFYTGHAQLGIDFFASVASCSFFSIFHILLWLCPRMYLKYMVQIVMYLKWSMTSLTMTYYVMHTKRNKLSSYKKLVAFVLGMAYGFSSYMYTYFFMAAGMDVFYLFPLLVLAFERLVETGNWKMYTIILFLCIGNYFYISFPICVFLVIWFFNQDFENVKIMLKKGIKFALCSVLAAAGCTVMLLPSYALLDSRYSLLEGHTDLSLLKSAVCDFVQWIEGFFMFQSIEDVCDLTPRLYTGIFFAVVLMCYAFAPINKKQKMKRIVSLLFITAGFFVPILNYIWHLTAVPHGYYHRFALVWIFLALCMCMEMFPYIEEIRLRYMGLVSAIWLILFAVAFFGTGNMKEFYVYYIMIILFALYVIMLVLYRRKSIRMGTFVRIVAILTAVELFVNGYWMIEYYNSDVPAGEYIYNDKAIEYSENLLLKDGQRISYCDADYNIGMYTGKDSMNGFVSYGNGGIIRSAYLLGCSTYGSDTTVEYRGGTPITNVLYNIAYGYGASKESFSDAEPVRESDLGNLYKMKRTVGIGYMADESLNKWDIWKGYPSEKQNEFVYLATGKKDVLTEASGNMVCRSSYGELEAQQDGYHYTILSDFDAIMVDYEVMEDEDLYFYCNSTQACTRILNIDNRDTNEFEDRVLFLSGTLHVGEVKKGQRIIVLLTLEGLTGLEERLQIEFFRFHEDRFKEAYEKLTENVFQIAEYKDGYIRGTIDVKEKKLMMTGVPAQGGWSVYVDGEKQAFDVIGTAFIGVPLEEGRHEVVFQYVTPYFKEGVCGSLISIFLFFAACILDKIRKIKAGK